MNIARKHLAIQLYGASMEIPLHGSSAQQAAGRPLHSRWYPYTSCPPQVLIRSPPINPSPAVVSTIPARCLIPYPCGGSDYRLNNSAPRVRPPIAGSRQECRPPPPPPSQAAPSVAGSPVPTSAAILTRRTCPAPLAPQSRHNWPPPD